MVYSVVMLDDKERQNLSLEEVKELFFKRQINQNSLIYSRENPQWQMLKRAFNVAAWIPSNSPPVSPNNSQNTFQTQPNNPPNAFQPQQNPFEQQSPAIPPVTFNQFSPQQTNPPTNNYAQNSSNGYSQNNQTETYYQAETNQSQYNFQNNQANFAPSNYNNQPNTSNNQSNNYKYSSNNNNFGDRNGLRPAATFLIVNAIFNVVLTLINYSLVSSAPAQSSSYNSGRFTGFFVSLIVDILLAVKLWKNDDVENARKWVLIRTYLGFIVFGIIVPFVSFGTDGKFAGVINFVAYFLLFVSILLVLHGKQNPSTSRVMVGIGTFAMFFLFNFGIIALSSIVMIAPNLSKLELTDKQLDKYRVEGKEFQDKTNGAKVVLPEGWSMLSLDNPLIHTPEARMIAIDKTGNSLTMLEVVPVPGNLDMKQANSTYVLDKLTEGVVAHLKEGDKDDFSGKGSFREITRINIYIGKHPAKLLVFEKTAGGIQAKGHLIITFDELTFYILHSWCPVKDYDKKQEDFTFFEKNFSVPDKINSPFTQSAETEKNKTNPKKNF